MIRHWLIKVMDKIIERWCADIARHLINEVKELQHDNKWVEARIITAIASALNKANGRLQ